MTGEFSNLCSCKLVNLRREGDEIIAELRCMVQEEAGAVPEAGAAVSLEEKAINAPVTKILKQESEASLQQRKE
ncbi:hypothetical protein SDD30_15950 [Moorella naiadis]|uniref:hypothetical protein n=1 Tax=Moorella naiadis (nom. illeg.) TaxID=3093670 RepID=UPI003D9CA159